MLRRSLLILVLFLVSSVPAQLAAAAQQATPDFSELEKVIAEELKSTSTPGCTVAIVNGDRVILAKGYGSSNVETGAPVAPDMLFRIGSTTKMYTTYALVALAQEGRIKLDEPIGNHAKGLSPKLSQVTAHQLMSHTAGMKDEAPAFGTHDEATLATTVRGWKDDYLFTEPGKVMSYSNPGLTLAGFVVQEVGGKLYADILSERLFKPLGMTSTTFRPTEAMTRPLSQGHRAPPNGKPVVVRPFADNAAYWPAGFMFSNVLDLARFAIAFMNDGRIEDKQALDPAVLKKLATGYTDAPSFPGSGKYAYGLMVHDTRGVHVVEHGGSIDGFGCLFRMVPEKKFAVIILANKSGQSMEKSAEKAMELMLPLGPKPEEETPKELPMTAAEMEDLVGTFSQTSEAGGLKLKFSIAEGKLVVTLGGPNMGVRKTGPDRYSVNMPGISSQPVPLVAVRGADGKIAYLHAGGRALKKLAPPN